MYQNIDDDIDETVSPVGRFCPGCCSPALMPLFSDRHYEYRCTNCSQLIARAPWSRVQ